MEDRPITVVLVDDDEESRVLLRVLFEADDRFEVVGEASDGVLAAGLASALRPDVLVIDLAAPVVDGLTVIDLARRDVPETRVVALSALPDPVTLLEVLGRGGHALLNKASLWAELVPTVLRLVTPPSLVGAGA